MSKDKRIESLEEKVEVLGNAFTTVFRENEELKGLVNVFGSILEELDGFDDAKKKFEDKIKQSSPKMEGLE